MPSLFNTSDNQLVIDRIDKLFPETIPAWGRMNVAQMLAHAQTTLEIALGERKLKSGLIGFLFGKIAKKKLMKDGPFKRNMPTAPSFLVKDERQFLEEKSKLISLIRRFGKTDPEEIAKRPHPFFGKLTTDEWQTLQYKHLDHHLTQFGV